MREMEEVTERLERPGLGTQGEPCPECGSPLARDQRYCLVCGARRAGLPARLAGEPERRPPAPRVSERETVTAAPAPVADSPWRLDAGLIAGVGCLLLALLVGVLIGKSGNASDSRRASTPQVVQLGGTPTTGTTGSTGGSATTASFTSDWPDGKRGFTVQLQTLPKRGTDAAAVAAAKQAASAKGAPAVGALDSNAYGTLKGGSYVIFSGQYADRRAAGAALDKLKAKFTGAKVIEVASSAGGTAQKTSASSSGGGTAATGKAKAPSAAQQAAGAKAIQDIQNSSGADYSKKSAKLPDTLVTPGAPPPIDKSKAAGGGTGSETFK